MTDRDEADRGRAADPGAARAEREAARVEAEGQPSAPASGRGVPADPEGTGPAEAPTGAGTAPAAGPTPAPATTADQAQERLEAGALGARAPAEGPSNAAVALSVVLPGAGHVLTGAWARGGALLLPWTVVLAILFLSWPRVSEALSEGSLDDWVALAVLAASLAALWGWSLRDLLRARRRAALEASGTAPPPAGDSQWAIAVRHFRRNGIAMAGLAVVVVLYLVALLAPFIAPYDPIAQRDLVATSYLAPSLQHWLGTDLFGRDILSRIIYGARISLSIAFVAVAIAITLGTLLGALAGYLGGWVDTAIMRFTDMVLAFPRLVLLILIVALFPPSLLLIILVLGLTQWPGTARIVRGEVLSLREREFIQAARALGMTRRRIILRHLIPNVLAPVIVAATLGIGNTIVLEAGLSFLGIGVQPPTPSWGNMVADGRNSLTDAWWVATFPGLTIVATVLAFNLAGDGLRDAMDPRLRE